MPRLDLKSPDGGLHPLAPFKVLAVMCHPADPTMRQSMLARLHRETGVGTPRRAGLQNEEFLKQVTLRKNRGILAGALLLTVLQLRENGIRPSLNRAIALVQSQLDKWQQPDAPDWTPDVHVAHIPHSRRKILDAFGEYLSAAHLWAAFLHGLQHDRDDIWPGSNPTLPRFIAYAEAFADKGARLPWNGRDRIFTLPREIIWRFGIPDQCKMTRPVVALPLNNAQRAILDTLASPNKAEKLGFSANWYTPPGE